jgi:hypothetical protein
MAHHSAPPNPLAHPRATSAVLLLAAVLAAPTAAAQESASDSRHRSIDAVLAHPPFATWYACAEHAAGALPSVGDDLGQDCLVQAMPEGEGVAVMRPFRGDGSRNEDWFGWNQQVLSPCDCTALRVHDNPVINTPGKPGTPPASFALLRADDGTFFIVAHLQDLAVSQGERVRAGQSLGRVGNNGFARMPHVHIGAWRGRDALQIRWDQHEMTTPGPASARPGDAP